jgi:hypothetical protein
LRSCVDKRRYKLLVKAKQMRCAVSITLPKQVDESAFIAQLLDRLLETGDAAACDTENLEQFVIEDQAFASLVMGILPFVGETCRSCSDQDRAAARRTCGRRALTRTAPKLSVVERIASASE